MVFAICVSSFLGGMIVSLAGSKRIGGAIVEWGCGCTFPLMLLMFILLWGSTAACLLAGRRYWRFLFTAFVTILVSFVLYGIVRALFHSVAGP